MSDCVSAQEFSENSPADTNVDEEIEAEGIILANLTVPDKCGEHDNISSSEHVDPIQKADDDCGSLVTTDEDGDGPASPPADDEVHSSSQVEDTNNPNSPESGEVSEEEYASGACSPSKNLESVQSVTVEDPENQDEFFEDDRSQTPLQDEQDTELVLKATDYLKTDDASSEFTPTAAAVPLNETTHSRHTDQNTDGELSDEDKMSHREIADNDIQNVPEVGKAVTVERKDSVERRPTDTDDCGELDYEEEEADDSLDKGKAGEERRKKDKSTNKDLADKKDMPSQDEVEDGEEPDEVKEVLKPKDHKVEKKLEPGEVPEEGEEPEEGEHSTDGELDDDDDCEEGEIREPGSRHTFVRPMCRFYTRGNCTWGANCRFLHPGINDKGNYAMIDPPYPGHTGMMGPGGPGNRVPPPPSGLPGPWIRDRLGKRVMPHRPPELDAEAPVAAAPLPAPPTVAEAATESAWERGLRHAKEIRKMAKRKETDPAFEGKKDSDPEEDKPEPVPAPLPPPQISVPLPPPRDPYYDDLPVRYEDDGFYARPPIPLPPPDAWPFRPPPMDPFEMRWPRGPMDFPPLPPPEFRLSERERAMRERRFSPPPRFEPGRPPEDRFGRYNRYEPRYYRDGPPRDPLPPPPTDVPVRGRGEEWKDPWLRSHSPKRKRASSSRSGSRGRRRSRSRSKGSYSSFSSSSYSSKSRSRSRSSSYSSSYSKSSRSRSYSSSRSSSRSRSRSKSARKPLPVTTTLGQSILEKHGKAGDGPRSVINKVLPSAIGSVPLPPEKTLASSVTQTIKAIPPPPPTPPAVTGSRPPVALEPDSMKSPPQVSQPAAKQLVPGAPVPIGAKPIVVPGRPAPLQPVGRGVAAAFSDKDDDHYDAPHSSRLQLPLPSSFLSSEKVPPATQTVDRSKGQPPAFSLERSSEKGPGLGGAERSGSTRLLPPPPEVDGGRSRDRTSVAPPKVSSVSRQPSSGDKPPGRASQPPPPLGKDIPKASQAMDRGQARSQAPDGERSSMKATLNAERVPTKAMPPVSDKSRGAGKGSSSQMAMLPGGKSGLRPSEGFGNRGPGDGRGGPAPSDRPKVDPALKRRERMRSSSTESSRSRSSSGSMSRSSSSGSRDSEHLYSDIASPISSASSISPVRSPPAKPRQGEKGRVPMNKNPSGRLLPPPPPLSSSQHIAQRSEGVRGELRDRAPPSFSRPPQSHLPSRGGGSRDLGREGSGRELSGREFSGRDPGGRELGREPSGRELGGREPSGRELGGREPSGRELGGRELGGRELGRELGGREPTGRELGGRELGGRELGGREPSGRELGGREPGGREPSGRELGGREFGGREAGGREPSNREPSGREISARSRDSVGAHPRDMGMNDARLRSSSSSAHAQQSRQPSDRNPGLHSSQKGNAKQPVKPERPNSQLPPPPAPNSRKRTASPLGRLSPPNKMVRRGIEQKEPVKITIPRHEKIVKPGSPPRRRSDAGHFQMTSPVSKAPMSKTTPSKAPAGSHAGGSSTSKKKTVSRREELLLQLQAVEDAIAKKRSKMQ